MLRVVFLVVLPCFLVVGAVADVRSRQIPNWLTATMAFAGLMLAVVGASRESILQCLLAGGLALLIGLAMQAARLMGGGDVKFFAALALWLGPHRTVDAALATAIAGGVIALFYLRAARAAGSAGLASSRLQLDDASRDFERVPYGVAIGVGGAWVWFAQLGLSGAS